MAERVAGARILDELEVPGGTLAYEAAGRGPPVLFIHSMIADCRMWDREFSRYAADHRVVRFDLRGYGRTPPPSAPFSYVRDVRSLIAHLGLERPILVGSSMGGAFAIDCALEDPGIVGGLLLAAPGLTGGFDPPFGPEELAAFKVDEAKSRPVAKAWSEGDAAGAFDRLRELWCPALEGPNLALFRRMVEENAAEVFEDRSQKLAKPGPAAAPRLSSLRVPTIVLVGDRDNPSSPVFASRIARSIPGARLEKVTGADHLVNLSRPQAFDAAFETLTRARP